MQQTYNPISGKFDLVNEGIGVIEPNNPQIGVTYFDTTLGSLLTWNGVFWTGLPITIEDFVYPSGDCISISGFTANGGSTAVISGLAVSDIPDLTDSVVKARYGEYQSAITNLANGFSSSSNASFANTPRYQLSLNGNIYIGGVWRQTTPGIDFVNNPVLACFGLLVFTATTTVNPLIGIYHRLPRGGETNFVKYVVREAGVETIQDTSIAFSANTTGYLKTALLWDGLNDTMHFITSANDAHDIKSITSFSTTYPSVFASIFHFGLHVIRNGTGAVNASVTLRMDKMERYVFNNYINYL
jgi:hypothetical protein